MHQPKPDQACQPTAGNDTLKNGFLSRLVVDVEWERVVLSRELYDLFTRNVVCPEVKYVARIVVLGISKIHFICSP